MSHSRPLLLACAALLSATPVFAHAECRLGKLAEVPVTMAGLSPLIPASVNGVEGMFLMDTGAFYSGLTKGGAAKAKLKMDRGKFVRLGGIGGQEDAQLGVARTFAFGGVTADNVEFLVGGKNIESSSILGLIGQNVLGSADVEIDLANKVVRFFKPIGCDRADLGYWAPGKTTTVPLDVAQSVRHSPILALAEVQGRPVKVLFDTGAQTSFLARDAARRIGLKLDGPEVKPGGVSRGMGKFSIPTVLVPVTSFSIGGETIRNTRLRVGDGGLGDADMLIGADFFLSHRVFVSKAQRRLYFSYNGGPVFRVEGPPRSASPAASAPAGASAPSSP